MVSISLDEKILESLEETSRKTKFKPVKYAKYVPIEKILKTLGAVQESTRTVYPEYYIILMSGVQSFRMYKEHIMNGLNTCAGGLNACKDYASVLYRFFFG